MKNILLLIGFFAASIASATPGDLGCEATIGGKKVEVLIGYDNHGQPASLLEVTVAGKKELSTTNVESGMINVGTEDEPFMNNYISGKNEQGSVFIRIPEQNPEAGQLEIFLSVDIPNVISIDGVEAACPY